MPTFRYNIDASMPDYLKSAAQRNLATAGAQVSAFNDRAKFFPMPNSGIPATNGATTTETTGSAFKFSGIGGPVDTSIGQPVPNSFVQPTLTNAAPQINGSTNNGATTSGGWRFDSFGPSQLNGASTNLSTPTSNTGNPLNLPLAGVIKPIATEEKQNLQKQYGWGLDSE